MFQIVRDFIWGRRKAKLARPFNKTTPKFARALLHTQKGYIIIIATRL